MNDEAEAAEAQRATMEEQAAASSSLEAPVAGTEHPAMPVADADQISAMPEAGYSGPTPIAEDQLTNLAGQEAEAGEKRPRNEGDEEQQASPQKRLRRESSRQPTAPWSPGATGTSAAVGQNVGSPVGRLMTDPSAQLRSPAQQAAERGDINPEMREDLQKAVARSPHKASPGQRLPSGEFTFNYDEGGKKVPVPTATVPAKEVTDRFLASDRTSHVAMQALADHGDQMKLSEKPFFTQPNDRIPSYVANPDSSKGGPVARGDEKTLTHVGVRYRKATHNQFFSTELAPEQRMQNLQEEKMGPYRKHEDVNSKGDFLYHLEEDPHYG